MSQDTQNVIQHSVMSQRSKSAKGQLQLLGPGVCSVLSELPSIVSPHTHNTLRFQQSLSMIRKLRPGVLLLGVNRGLNVPFSGNLQSTDVESRVKNEEFQFPKPQFVCVSLKAHLKARDHLDYHIEGNIR